MPNTDITIRNAKKIDLEQINRVIEAAVMSWNMAERVKRLSLSSYRYNEQDFNHIELVVAEDDVKIIRGVAGWELAHETELPEGQSALLLHGLYVEPAFHHQGIGQKLFSLAEAAAHNNNVGGLLVRAQKDAKGFFSAQGMTLLAVENPSRNYLNRFWKGI